MTAARLFAVMSKCDAFHTSRPSRTRIACGEWCSTPSRAAASFDTPRAARNAHTRSRERRSSRATDAGRGTGHDRALSRQVEVGHGIDSMCRRVCVTDRSPSPFSSPNPKVIPHSGEGRGGNAAASPVGDPGAYCIRCRIRRSLAVHRGDRACGDLVDVGPTAWLGWLDVSQVAGPVHRAVLFISACDLEDRFFLR